MHEMGTALVDSNVDEFLAESSTFDSKDELLDLAEAGTFRTPPPPNAGSRRRAWSTSTFNRDEVFDHQAAADAEASFPPPLPRTSSAAGDGGGSRNRSWSMSSAPAGNFERLQQQQQMTPMMPRAQVQQQQQQQQPSPLAGEATKSGGGGKEPLKVRVVPADADGAGGETGGPAADQTGGSGSGGGGGGKTSELRRPRSVPRMRTISMGLGRRRGTSQQQQQQEQRVDDRSATDSSSRSGGGRIRRSVSARTLINLGRLGGVEAVETGERSESTGEPIVDLRQIAQEAGEADDSNLADLAMAAAATQAAGENSGQDDGGADIPLVKQLISYFRNRPWKKKVLMLTVIGSVIWVCVDFATTGYIRAFLDIFMDWMQRRPVAGFFAFIVMFIVTTLVFIPPSILTLGSGVAFARAFGLGPGIFLASSASFFGSCVGAVIAFFRARYLMRDLVKLFANRYPIVKAADLAIKHKGFRIYLLLRMCPIIPFNAINYIGGITGVKWTSYTMALIGILPWQIVLVFIGGTVGSVDKMRDDVEIGYSIISITVGCVFSVLSLVIMWYYARKELKKEIAAHQPVDEAEQDDGDVSSVNSDSSRESFRSNRSALGSTISSLRRRVSFQSLGGFGDLGEADRSINEGEDTEWFWIWT